MILADTSVWIRHFRQGLADFTHHLEAGEIAIHSVVLGELATGNLSRRSFALTCLRALPQLPEGTREECMIFIETQKLYGRGLGWNDIQLLIASRLSAIPLWSLDQSLIEAAKQLGIAASLHLR